MRVRRFLVPVVFLLLAGPAAAQVAAGTLFQSIDNLQGPGVTAVGLPGNPSITPSEILAWSSGEAPGRDRSFANAQELSLILGDRNGDNLLADMPDVDALEVDTFPSGTTPSPYAFRFSIGAAILNAQGATIATTGDILRFNGVGVLTTVIPRGAFQAALGTSAALDVDGYLEMPDGAVLVSFAGTGSGNNIISPLSGNPGTVTWNGADVFIVRPPFGTLPAILAFRASDLQPIVGAVFPGYSLGEIVGIEVQPGTALIANPWDPTNLYGGGTRPHLLFTVLNDENVLCTNPAANPLGNSNLWAVVEGASGGGFTTNGSSNQVNADALAVGNNLLGAGSRATIDPMPFGVPGGTNLTLVVRSAQQAGTAFQLVVTTAVEPGLGLPVANPGYPFVTVATFDPLLALSLSPGLAPILTTAAADANGTAQTVPIPMPFAFGLNVIVQGFSLTASPALVAPSSFRIL